MENKKTRYIIANSDKDFLTKVIEHDGELWVYHKGDLLVPIRELGGGYQFIPREVFYKISRLINIYAKVIEGLLIEIRDFLKRDDTEVYDINTYIPLEGTSIVYSNGCVKISKSISNLKTSNAAVVLEIDPWKLNERVYQISSVYDINYSIVDDKIFDDAYFYKLTIINSINKLLEP